MSRVATIGTALAAFVALLVFALVVSSPNRPEGAGPAAEVPVAIDGATGAGVPGAHAHSGFLYGRIAARGATYEGRLRFGGDQEAFWSDFFNGAKDENPWAAHWPERPANNRPRFEIFGFEFGGGRSNDLDRLFLARFGDIARIDAHFADVLVTLKSGTTITLDRFETGDIDDGVRVWDVRRGVVNLDARQIDRIEFLPTPPLAGAPGRLHGTVRTRQGTFTGFIQWDQEDGVSSDTLDGRAGDSQVKLRYDAIRAIARQSRTSAHVTLLDGQELALSGSREVGRGHRGIYVDDPRYGRVLVSWDAFERVDFGPGGGGPGYDDFPPGRALTGSVLTRDGRRLAGRLVYDFDESETTETLDVSSAGIDYAIPFGQLASIVPPGRGPDAASGRVVLQSGEELRTERSGDLGDRNAGMLIFTAGRDRPEYVPWADVERIEFDAPPGADGASR